MKLEVRELRKKDYKKAIQSAIIGMHFNWYTDSKLAVNLYGKYFWYLEMTRATQVSPYMQMINLQACCWLR